MYYENSFIDGLESGVSLDKNMYANIQAHNVAKMLVRDKSFYKLFGVYWWQVKDMLRKYLDNGEWYCGVQDDPLMKERSWHGSEFRTVLAAMYYMNENAATIGTTGVCRYFDEEGGSHPYTLFDADAGE